MKSQNLILGLGIALTWGYAMLAGAPPAQAFPPAGSPCIDHPDLPDCVWWRNQTNIQTGSPCCGAPGQDGHILSEWDGKALPKEDDWRIDSTAAAAHDTKWPGGCSGAGNADTLACGDAPSGYQIFLGGIWVGVPWRAQTTVRGVEPDASLRYKAKAWWSTSTALNGEVSYYFFCFQAGAGY